ncbi:hypothetical protein NM208_g5691 [Fusarium decemcellulare]|uniref:Uncharacterized protein n=2 Tax=Fusarium decemcellulare TaxID=57161 RepID=A0ACC1SCH0_9HYPO|nr:hypothetical protein NM208_g6683 [Fusarium decemcellulare]KAJ3538933.1 hypothetical protein NM208_g5691 [Fusarium decemcellulare]
MKEAKWVAVGGVVCLAIDGGLFSIMRPGINLAAWFFPSLLVGGGIGSLGVIIPVVSTLCTPNRYIATAVALGTSVRGLDGAVGVVIFTQIFSSKLTKILPETVTAAVVAAGLPLPSVPGLIKASAAHDEELLRQIPGVTREDSVKSATTNLPEEQVSGDDGQAAVDSNVSLAEPKNDKDDGEQSGSDDKLEEAAEQISELHRLLQETANDADGSIELGDKLEKWKDPKDPNRLGDLVNTPLEDSETTPLHIATERGFLDMTRRLLEAGANVNAQDDEGRQPIHIACSSGNDDLLILLLKHPDYTPKADDDEQYPLHTACYGANLVEPGTFRLFLQSDISHINKTTKGVNWTPLNMATYWGKEQAVDILLGEKPKLGIPDNDGWTPLIAAAKEGHYGILNKLISHLKTEPKKAAAEDEDVDENAIDKQDNQKTTALMELCKDAASSEEALKCLKNILKLHPAIDVVDNQEQTALHHIMLSAAAIKTPKGVMEEVLNEIIDSTVEKDLLKKDSRGETAFDVVFEEDGLVEGLRPFFLRMVDRLRGKEPKELLPWLTLRVERHTFANELLSKMSINTQIEQGRQLKPRDLGEWAIHSQLPGCLLTYVMAIGQNGRENEHGKFKEARERWKKTIRDLKGKQPNRGEKKKKKDDQPIQSDDKNKDKGISILQDMEDIVDFFFVEKAPTSKESRKVSMPTSKMEESLAQFYAAVIQMSQGDDELIRFTKFRTVQDVIYGTENLATVGETIRRFEKMRSGSHGGIESTNRDDTKPRKEFTWIHLPSTNMVWMNDILRKVLKRSECGDDNFEELASFLRASWVEIPDRTSPSRFMRPRFVKSKLARVRGKEAETEKAENFTPIQEDRDDREGAVEGNRPEDRPDGYEEERDERDEDDRFERDEGRTSEPTTTKVAKTKNFDGSALYMPYLSFSTYRTQDKEGHNDSASGRFKNQDKGESRSSRRRERRRALFRAYEGERFHASSTLDEYYYHFAKDDESAMDQDSRNEDQVVTKYLRTQGLEDDTAWPLLRVNQLWAWTIGEEWLITASSCASSDEKSKFVMDILTHLRKRTKDGNHWPGPASPADLRNVIAEYCIGVYERKYELCELLSVQDNKDHQISIARGNQGDVGGGGTQEPRKCAVENPERSIRQIFSDSINTIGRGEADLFNKFCNGSPQDKAQEKMQEKEREQSQEKEQQLTELKEATEKAAKLLFKIKDVRDELNILKTIARSQQKVQFGMAGKKLKPTCHTCHNLDNDLTAQYILGDLNELDKAAAQTQEALHTTITLQDSQIANLQAEESVEQSRLANIQANESAKQSKLAYNQAEESKNLGELAADQGRIVLVFTLATVLFAPLSFFSSLFALDVETFLEAPAWAVAVIFTAPLPLLGLAGAYAFWPKNAFFNAVAKLFNRKNGYYEAGLAFP